MGEASTLNGYPAFCNQTRLTTLLHLRTHPSVKTQLLWLSASLNAQLYGEHNSKFEWDHSHHLCFFRRLALLSLCRLPDALCLQTARKAIQSQSAFNSCTSRVSYGQGCVDSSCLGTGLLFLAAHFAPQLPKMPLSDHICIHFAHLYRCTAGGLTCACGACCGGGTCPCRASCSQSASGGARLLCMVCNTNGGQFMHPAFGLCLGCPWLRV